ncbi:hypothetical protein K7432_001564 [Basidiobolus ranarum]|uniref:RanBD1 domain-containing protein n=1 Tax=Basidiobolus ranarum TaxID=34480 RepID=A0ABR2W9B8_9FUNG
MSKRGAEKQLTQLNQHEEDENADQMSGFRQASEEKLAARKIKKPVSRRAKAGSGASTPSAPSPFSSFTFGGTPVSAPPTETTEEKPKPAPFAGFTFGAPSATPSNEDNKLSTSFGFGNQPVTFGTDLKSKDTEASETQETSSKSAFTFGASNNTDAKPITSTGFTFGGQVPTFGGNKKESESPFTFGKPASPAKESVEKSVSMTQSNDTKIPSTGFTFGAPPAAKSDSINNVDSKSTDSEDKKEHYKQLRGLNVSFVEHVKKQLEINPFVDFSLAFDEYKTHSASIKKKSAVVTKSSDLPKATTSPFTFGAPAKSDETKADDKANSTFSFGASSSTDESQPKPTFGFGAVSTKSNEVAKSGFTFGASPATAKSDVTTESPFTFGSSKDSQSEEKPNVSFGFGSSVSETKVEEKPKSSSTFGASSDANKSEDKPKSSFSFGSSTTNSSTSPFSFGISATSTTPEKPSTGFSFGVSKTPSDSKVSEESKTTPTSTEHKKTSISFGSGLASSTVASASSPLSPSSSTPFGAGFTFGTSASPQAKKVADNKEQSHQDEDKEDDEEEEKEEETSNPELVKTGAGEEEETTIHEVRCKLYCWNKEKKSYADLGIGIFKMNENTNNQKKRFLVRTEGSGKVTLNVAVFPEMKIDYVQNKKDVSIIAVGEGNKPQKYLVRVKTPEQAAQLYKKIQDNKA